jgi:acetyl-CoA C-acetyltransferase
MHPFVTVAEKNPYRMFDKFPDMNELSQRTSMITSTYNRWLCAKEKVNQAAAVIITSEEKAKALGIPEDKWVYPYGGVDVTDRAVIARENYHHSASLKVAAQRLFADQPFTINDIAYIDVYSCFPVVVEFAMDAFDMAPTADRPLTLTGGLAFFGGPGNNYSMHAIAEVVDRLRADTGALGMIVANGGIMNYVSAGIYGAKAPVSPWIDTDQADIDARIRASPFRKSWIMQTAKQK